MYVPSFTTVYYCSQMFRFVSPLTELILHKWNTDRIESFRNKRNLKIEQRNIMRL